MDDAATQDGLRTVVVALGPVQPRVSTDILLMDGLDAIGSRFSTYFDPDNHNRAQNITLAAKIVDGTIVEAGEEFSLNATLGPRTTNRGFDYALSSRQASTVRASAETLPVATTLFSSLLPLADQRAATARALHRPLSIGRRHRGVGRQRPQVPQRHRQRLMVRSGAGTRAHGDHRRQCPPHRHLRRVRSTTRILRQAARRHRA
jgi:hypothetical protein